MPLFEGLDRSYVNLPEQTPFQDPPTGNHTQTMNVAQGKLAIGVDQDQYAQFIDTQPDWAAAIVTSALKNSDVALVECIRLLSEGKFREKLQELLEEIFHPDIPFTQTDVEDKCTYCDFKAMCRK